MESWMHREDRKVTAQEIALLERARKTLEGNLAMPGEGHVDPLPWHPLRGIRPSLDEYDGIWNWDSAFHAVAVSRWDPELAREQIRILLDAQLPSGALPDVLFMNGEIVDRFGKPPVMPWAMMLVDRRDPDDAFLALAYDRFVDYEAFWRRERGGEEEGLFHYDSDSDDPAERLDDAKLESGWDDSVRFDEASFDLWPVDLNCFMVMLYRAMSTLAVRCGRNADIESWQSKAQALSDRIEAKLWDEASGRYADRRRSDGAFSGVLSPAIFMPLFVGTASPERAERMAQLAADPERFFPGMPTVSYDDSAYLPDGFWRGPTWLNTAYFALRGLKDYGFDATADACRDTILGWCSANEDAIYERYDSRSGKGLGDAGFSWSAAFLIEFILEWP